MTANTPSFSPDPTKRGLFGNIRKMRELTLILIIVGLFIVMSFASPYFLTWANMKAMLLSFSTEGIVVVGMTMLLIVGGIDLSVGAVMCLAMVMAAKLFVLGMNPWLASLSSIGICSIIGLIMGNCVTRIGMHHFIVTLAFMGIARGASMVITQGTPISLFSLPPEFKFVGQGTLWGVPFSIIIFFVVVIIADYLLRNATAFRKIFYTGSNERAAEFSGIRTKRIKIGVTVLSSTLCGLAGIIYMSKFGAATPNFGVGLELNIIAAAVIGGASLKGGEGTVFGAILGIALLSVVSSSLILLNVSVYWQDLIKGLILLAAVAIDHILHNRSVQQG
ncbi:ABC transporter permease [Saccharospirillum sp. MSK14-1]|uniref:ABC transporter permease n=1 Tax=Saccharospirillum sp. MSK14-1 TaxID=1897632 RepID=UPI000D342350|nr:ABC transporter permease [Saccharospirillum sp. MSK14-1]PTY38739.1 ABC transporter permease [Saccharospirillum sp. MSK14-1]